MRIDQPVVRHVVVECFLVELDDVGSTPFVVGVTLPAFLGQRRLLASMQALMLPAIDCNLLVAIEAEARLRLPREGFVALSAFAFELGMLLGQRARHNQFFKQRLRSKPGRQQRNTDHDSDNRR
ncbi:hypothetical protein [Bradyrhizobium sp. SZCCHNR2028]|uniref:hypothetical protein n=1 Tax=Bradyrhizobium sp. SZCCHNR2028 TaxID=3057382 RepID=UPI0028E53E0C|nr:hypothetical protein [Bradyrhizobium sp. SZCCHNR2028]